VIHPRQNCNGAQSDRMPSKRTGNRWICNNFHHLRGVFPFGFTSPEPPVNTIIIVPPTRPSFRLPVDGTAVFTAVRRRYGMLWGQEFRDGTGRFSVRPSVQASWTGTVTIPIHNRMKGWKERAVRDSPADGPA
jgi:hypothetical protein